MRFMQICHISLTVHARDLKHSLNDSSDKINGGSTGGQNALTPSVSELWSILGSVLSSKICNII